MLEAEDVFAILYSRVSCTSTISCMFIVPCPIHIYCTMTISGRLEETSHDQQGDAYGKWLTKAEEKLT